MFNVNLGSVDQPKAVKLIKVIEEPLGVSITRLIKEYTNVFAWSYKDIKGIEPKFY